MVENGQVVLQLKGISKAYPGVQALDNVDISLRKGEVHALVGENGAGKSTLIKCISGAIKPDGGEIILHGEKFNTINPLDTIQHGIATVYQELNLVNPLTVAENIFLGQRGGRKLYSQKTTVEECRKVLEEFDLDIDPRKTVWELSIAQRQLVEIAKAVTKNAKILILDEPTSSLTVSETQFLFDMIGRLKIKGVTIVYISHIMEETFALSDRITVMRDGKCVTTLDTDKTNRAELIRYMVGREVDDSFPARNAQLGEIVLEAKNISGPGVKDISFSVRRGEILGFAGLVGAGRSELMNIIFGAAKKTYGIVKVDGKELNIKSPLDAIRSGLGIIPEDRKQTGLILRNTIEFNISCANIRNLGKHGLMNFKKARAVAEDFRKKFRIKTPAIDQVVQNLSGGNQQKVVIARALAPNPKIIIFDEPTRGIDVGAKHEIYKLMNQLVEQGSSIIMVSSEMNELLGMADRVIVLAEGRYAGELSHEEMHQEKILDLASRTMAV